jgi:hypothetical protein
MVRRQMFSESTRDLGRLEAAVEHNLNLAILESDCAAAVVAVNSSNQSASRI